MLNLCQSVEARPVSNRYLNRPVCEKDLDASNFGVFSSSKSGRTCINCELALSESEGRSAGRLLSWVSELALSVCEGRSTRTSFPNSGTRPLTSAANLTTESGPAIMSFVIDSKLVDDNGSTEASGRVSRAKYEEK